MAPRRFVLDPSYRRPGGGAVVVGGSPLRLFTLGPRGVDVVAAIERGGEPPAGHEALTDRLLDAGAIHPVADTSPGPAALLTIVIPCYDAAPLFRPVECRTLVVDDASPTPVPAVPGVEVLRLDTNVGPGGARQAGLVEVGTPFVAFVDADVSVDERSLRSLLGHLDDPRVALVAPRVRAEPGPGTLARFEADRSPLDMGDRPARVAATTRVSYVPAAVLVCRTEALRSIGGFDPSLRLGEDVDLVWRLAEAGWRCRYEPAVVAHHRTRPTLRSWLRQRFGYGTSAAPLAERHRGALAPVRMNGWTAATWGAVAAGAPVVGLAIGTGSTLALVRKLRSVPAVEAVRLAALGHLHAGRLLAATLTRVWWPVALGAALVSRRARRLVAVAVALTTITGPRGGLDPVRGTGLRLLDDLAYGTGVWAGAIEHRSLDAIMPALQPWPPRSPAAQAATSTAPG